MHAPVFDLYYKYLYYQVVFARVNTWKVLRNSLRWSSWTELACFSGFTRFCPIFLCVCMFIWVYMCPCIYPTNKQAAWRAVIILGQDKYTLPCFLELLQTLVKLSWTARKDLVCSHVGSLSLSAMQTKAKWENFAASESQAWSHQPFLPGACDVARSHVRIAGTNKRRAGDLLLPWNFAAPPPRLVDLCWLLLLPLKNTWWKETLDRRQHFLTSSVRDLMHTVEQHVSSPVDFSMYLAYVFTAVCHGASKYVTWGVSACIPRWLGDQCEPSYPHSLQEPRSRQGFLQ